MGKGSQGGRNQTSMTKDAGMTKTKRMRALLEEGKLLVSPGVYDGYSARLVEAMGFKTAATTGAGLSNSMLSQPDIGILSLRDNVDAVRHLARSVSIPLMADADTGYGNAVTVYHVVQYFEEAGVVGINLEDQVSPKRCGHMKGKEIISMREMVKKIEAAVKAKRDENFIINARTDAIALEEIEGAVRRLRAYAAAGADMVYPEAIRDEDDIKRVIDAVDVPVSINMGFGLRSRPTTPLIPLRRLEELGVARVSLPRMLPAAAIAGMKKALELMRTSMETGEIVDRPDLLAGMEEITALMGYAHVAELEATFLLEEQIEIKYQAERPDYVIR